MTAAPAVIPTALDGERIDRAVALLTGDSRAAVRELVASGRVRLDGAVATKPSQRVRAGQQLAVSVDEAAPEGVVANAAIPVVVVYEDADVIVVDKPAGLVVHPGAGHRDDTLVSGLRARYPEIAEVGERQRPGIVHRLDKGTSGLMVVARSEPAYRALVRQLASRSVERTYRALACGHFDARAGVIDAPIGRSVRTPTRMAVSARGREARTRYRVEDSFSTPIPAALLVCQLESGRTHQIRVHLAAIGAPVLGDDRYGGRRTQVPLGRPFLHAAGLAFEHPVTGERVRFASALPPDLQAALARFG